MHIKKYSEYIRACAYAKGSFYLFDILSAEVGEGSLEVRLQPCGRLVGELDATAEHSDGDGVGRVRGQIQPELFVAPFKGKLVQLLFELNQPARHEVDVVEDHPVPVSVRKFKARHRHNILMNRHTSQGRGSAKIQQ